MPKLKDLTGQKFGKLTVIKRDDSKKGVYWLCKCDCGSDKVVSIPRSSLVNGLTKSCGCLKSKAKKHNKYILSNEYGIGYTSNTKKEFYFDLEDYDKIKDYCWWENSKGYVVSQRDRKNIRLHRIILNLKEYTKDNQVDHINHNTLDNRKENLRICNNQENSMNKDCKGYYYDKEKNKYVGSLTYKGKKYFKYFNTPKEAKEYRRKLEEKYFKDFSYKNNL